MKEVNISISRSIMNKLYFYLLVLGMPIVIACNNNRMSEVALEKVSQESSFQVPQGWSLFKNNIFSIAYPQSMEIRNGKSEYQQDLNQLGMPSPNGNTVIFQQKGLNEKEAEAYTQYIRVMITPTVGNKGDFLKAFEEYGRIPDYNNYEELQAWGEMNRNIKDLLFSLILHNCQRLDGTYSIVKPTRMEEVCFFWEKIGNGYAINTHYVRNREIGEGQVRAEIYFFQNNSQAVIIVASCPADEYDKTWSEILSPMIQSFRWTHVFE